MALGWSPGGEVDSGYAQQGDNGQNQANQADPAATVSAICAICAICAILAGGASSAICAICASRTGFGARGARRTSWTDRTALTGGSRVSLGTGRANSVGAFRTADTSRRQVQEVRASLFPGSGLTGGQSVYHKADICAAALADVQNVTAAEHHIG